MTWQPDMAMTTSFGAAGTAVAVGLASAGGFALSNAMQHRAAGTVPATVQRAFAVLTHLARQPLGLVATGISFCALLLHAVALQFGLLVIAMNQRAYQIAPIDFSMPLGNAYTKLGVHSRTQLVARLGQPAR